MTKINHDIGERPRLAWIDIDAIIVNAAYQRTVDRRKVTRILENFRWDHFGAVVLAPAGDNKFCVTDGQHRIKAAQLHPTIRAVPATIIGASGVAAEAENFLTINRERKAVTALERFWAGVAAGDPETLRLKDVCEAAGCDIAPERSIYKPKMTAAVAALSRALSRYGDRAVRLSLQTIMAAFPRDPKALRGTLIAAIARIVHVNDDLSVDRLAAELSRQDIARMTAEAEAFRKISGGSAETALARAIVEIYNRGRAGEPIYFGAEN